MKLKRIPYKKWWKSAGDINGLSLRPTKASLGMSYTAMRSKHPIGRTPQWGDGPRPSRIRDSVKLRLNGTLDALGGGIRARHKITEVRVLILTKNKAKVRRA